MNEGYRSSLTVGAVLRGIYNNLAEGGSTYETTWAKVLAIDTAKNSIRVSLYNNNECPAGANYPPRPLLKLSRWGHISDEARQSTYLLSSRDQRIALLTHVTKPIVTAANIASWQGKLNGLTWQDASGQTHQLSGYGNVMGNLYISGGLHVGGELTGGITDKMKSKAIAQAKAEQLESERSYLLARADAVLAAHPQLQTTHREEFGRISTTQRNERARFVDASRDVVKLLRAFVRGDLQYRAAGSTLRLNVPYEELWTQRVAGQSLAEWYDQHRNAFETAIVNADRGKDGANGRNGRDGAKGEKGDRVAGGALGGRCATLCGR